MLLPLILYAPLITFVVVHDSNYEGSPRVVEDEEIVHTPARRRQLHDFRSSHNPASTVSVPDLPINRPALYVRTPLW